MMLSDLQINDLVYQQLNISAITTQISGEIWKINRPLDSQLEDVVINCLPTNNLQVQTAIANVNIHVQNINNEVSGSQEAIANYARLRELTALVLPILTDRHFENYWFDVQQQHVFQDETTNNYYSNIRVAFYFINI